MNKLLEEREKTHGDFKGVALTALTIKAIVKNSKNYKYLSGEEEESLDMIASKIGRILNGNPHEIDHWRDIAGYAKLVVKSLEPKNFRVKLKVKKEKSQ
jgi:hypothetical protein